MTRKAEPENKKISVTVLQNDSQKLEVSLQGSLTIDTVPMAWKTYYHFPYAKELIIHAQSLLDCDEAGVAFLAALEQRQEKAGGRCTILQLTDYLQDQLDRMLGKKELDEHFKRFSSRRFNFVSSIGHATVNLVSVTRENVIFVGAIVMQLLWAFRHPEKLRWKDVWRVAEDVGPNALVIIALIGFLMGLISAFQAAIPMKQFGVQIYIANLVGVSLIRELGPLMTAILLAGRTASAFSAEIGTMKINQEIDALNTMGLKPVFFLAVPRIIATTIMTPILNVFLIFFGLLGCFVVMKSLGFTWEVYIRQLQQIIHFKGFMGGMVKAFVFGLLISSVGCLHGLKTRMGASAVGESTTRAVVTSIILIIIFDGIFACVYYALGV